MAYSSGHWDSICEPSSTMHAGRIQVQQADGSWLDGSQTTLSGLPIPGTPRDILPGAFETDAR